MGSAYTLLSKMGKMRINLWHSKNNILKVREDIIIINENKKSAEFLKISTQHFLHILLFK